MQRLPLALAVHPSSWRLDGPGIEEDVAAQVFERDRHTCRFCGLWAAGHQEIFHLDGDHARSEPGNLVTACPLCHDCQHLGRDNIEQEFAVIWLPEVSQPMLNHVARAVHVVLHAHDEPAHMAERPRTDTPRLRAAFGTYRALADRMGHARRRIGTTSPRELGAALIGLPPAASARRAELTSGLRLLPRGRLSRDGEDIYPALLDAWTTKDGPLESLPGTAPGTGQPGRSAAP